MYLLVGTLTPVVIFAYLTDSSVNKKSLINVNRKYIVLFGMILLIPLLYLVNIVYYGPTPILYKNFISYVNFSTLLLIFLTIIKDIQIPSSVKVQWLLFALSLITLLAVIYNSFFWRIPEGVTLLPKYFVGPFIRAGVGYLDPNYFSINIIILFFLILNYIDNHFLKTASFIMLFLSYLFTFSRGALIFGTLTLLIYLFNNDKKTFKLFTLLLSSAFLIAYLTDSFDLSILFDRFTREEGKSSVEDRLFQYHSFFLLLENYFSIKNLLLGFGGQELFMFMFGAHLHSFWLSLLLDIGILGPFIIIFLLIYFFKNAKNNFSKYLLIFWFLQISFLPNVPDTLYLIFILSQLNKRVIKIKAK